MPRRQTSAPLVDVASGIIWQQLLRFFYPIALGSVLQLSYNLADSLIVGHFLGKYALAAVSGAAANLLLLIVGLFTGLSAGSTVVIAHHYGAGDREQVGAAVGSVMLLALIAGAGLTLVCQLSAPACLVWLRTPADTMALSLDYLQIVLLSVAPMLVYQVGSGILRAVGDSRRPLLLLATCCLLNILLDLLFVAGFRWGVAGAAAATALAQTCSALLVLWILRHDQGCYRLLRRHFRIHPRLSGEMVRVGIPAGLQVSMYNVANLIIMAVVNDLGTDFVAAWGTANKVDSLSWMLVEALGIALLTVVGQNYGAGRMDRVKTATNSALLIACAFTIVLSGLSILFSRPLMALFVDDAAVVDMGSTLIRFFCAWYLAYFFIEVYAYSLRGMGDSLLPALITGLGVCGLRLLWVLKLGPLFTNLPPWLQLSAGYPVSWVATSLAFLIYFPLRFRQLRRRMGQSGEK